MRQRKPEQGIKLIGWSVVTYLAYLGVWAATHDTHHHWWWPNAVGWAFVTLVVAGAVIIVLPVWPKKQPESGARVKAKDSPDWTWEDTEIEGEGPLVDAERSPGWKWKATRFRRGGRERKRSS
jgi:hypothetical protein